VELLPYLTHTSYNITLYYLECPLYFCMNSSHALLKVINDILDYSKIEAEKMESTKTYFNFSNVIDDVLNLFKVTVTEKN